MILRKTLPPGIILSGPAAADAQPITGFRRSTGAGVNWVNSPQDWARYNGHLLQRSADAVAAELACQSISRNETTVTADGESRPLMPAANDVRVPQSRRVEPILR